MTKQTTIFNLTWTAMAALACTAGASQAAPVRTQSGSWASGTWSAQSTIIGQTSTATLAGGGDPLYLPSRPQKNGVVQLLLDYGDLGSFVCSGSLASDRRSIITAAHCVTAAENLGRPKKTTAFFFDGDPDTVVLNNPATTAIEGKRIFVVDAYTGNVIDQNDLAIIQLKERAPDFATAYDIYDGGDLTGKEFNVAGYGRRSDTGGAVGANLGTGRLREGDNKYEFRFGDPIWNGELDFFGDIAEYSYVADFDNGLAINDATCEISIALDIVADRLCDGGLGAREVNIAGGDSGGPGFVDGKLATVNSYGLSFGQDFGDYDGQLNSSWGEYAGYVPLFLHTDFIAGIVPEPGSVGMMGLGLGLIGLRVRRRSAR